MKSLKKRLQIINRWNPFSWNTFFFLLIFWAGKKIFYLPLNKENAENNQLPLIRIICEYLSIIALFLLAISILSTLFSYFYYRLLKKQNKLKLSVQFSIENTKNKKKQFLHTSLSKVVKPLLGFVQLRLLYDQNQQSKKIPILGSRFKKNTLYRESIVGKSRIELPDIKEYQLNGVMLYFEDVFQILSLPAKEAWTDSFYQSPDRLPESIDELAPKQADTMDIRIKEMRKVEGDLLHHKNFESGDDVRRIVWKMYAKNRTLMVRTPEQLEPYASRLNLYVSFYNSIPTILGSDDYLAEMLNYYKNRVWSIYQNLQIRDWQIKYIPDQRIQLAENLDDTSKNERIISNSMWQKDLSTQQYFSAQKGSILVISSLNDPNEIAQILEDSDASVQIIFIPLSPLMHQYLAWNWFKRIFFIPAPDRLSKLKARWFFSPIRRKILSNEKAIKKMLG